MRTVKRQSLICIITVAILPQSDAMQAVSILSIYSTASSWFTGC